MSVNQDSRPKTQETRHNTKDPRSKANAKAK
jgi:hypothetical protein